MKGPDFEQLVGDEPNDEERARLRRTHELLLVAGPAPDLPPSLRVAPGSPPPAELVTFPGGFPRRRAAASLVAAAALALLAFGAGYLVGHRGDDFAVDFVLPMEGTEAAPQARASLEVAEIDEAGNWPMRLTVRNLPERPNRGRYQMWLTRDGKPVASCGYFVVEGDQTTVLLNAPYRLRLYEDWVITRAGSKTILLTTPPGARERA